MSLSMDGWKLYLDQQWEINGSHYGKLTIMSSVPVQSDVTAIVH